MPTFSIIVPAYNVQDYIEEALTSIAGQSFVDFEAIIVDDGSTDATGAIAQVFCVRDSRFRYIHQPNRGQSTARNVGTAVASGTYLYYMDSDDIIDADTLDLCFREFTRQDIDVVMFEASAFPVDAPTYKREENSYLRPVGKSPLWSEEFVIESLRQKRYFVSPCCLIAHRSAVGELRFIDGIVYEDNHFFVALLLEKRLRVGVLNQRLFKRRLRSNSTMFEKKTLHHYNSMYRLVHEMSELSFGALEPPERAKIRNKIMGKTLGDLHFASSLVGPDIKMRIMNVAATWHVATHISLRLFTAKRLLLALVPEIYRLQTQARFNPMLEEGNMRRLEAGVGVGAAPIATEPVCRPSPERTAASQMSAFAVALQAHCGETPGDYPALHALSVAQYRTFWRCFVEWCEGLDYAGEPEPVCVGDECESATFFPQLELNYADNLLKETPTLAHAYAVTACHADGRRVRMTRAELRERVARLAGALERLGLRSGERVAAVMRNDENAVIAALAVAALGATLSTAAPDMGTDALLDRFGQLSPKLLLSHTATLPFDVGTPLPVKIAELAAGLGSLEGIVSLDDGPLPGDVKQPVLSLNELVAGADAAHFVWRRFPFNHPLFIMFSSGTTGKPKCIVHGAGGTLIEHLKEHRLHSDFRDGDKLYFHTSCSWMMWNWQLSSLASGVEIVTYDGPLASVDILWRLVADEGVTVFGTSPAYLKMCSEAKLEPARQFDLRKLRAMMSTGAVLFDAQYDWVRDNVKPLPLQSISGGTDIIGCFVLGNPDLPVYAGEAQCKSLALDVCAWDAGGPTDLVGELVCRNPFPSRPLGFFGDTDGSRFHAAYFAANPGVWTHGDRIEFSSRGGARLHGRSDGVLNVQGIKVGPGDIYRIISEIPGIHEAMVVQQRIPADGTPWGNSAQAGDQRVVLLLVLEHGLALTGPLKARVRRDLARGGSHAHVPDVIVQVDELPVTHSGKLSDAAVRNALNGLPIGNAAALRNPACLDRIRHHPGLAVTARGPAPAVESRGDLEHFLQGLWERLFDFSPIERDANFFELGGDSLLGAALVAEIEQATGRTISLATLLAAPTITRLAAELRADVATPASQTIAPMRAGNGNPVFVLHSITGSVMESSRLVGRLQCPRPFYGLHARGLGGDVAPQRSVEEMAASYIAEIRRVQPEGPYSLIGYSFGGMVAFEIAQQLNRAGHAIELLCLLDTYVNERYLPWPDRLQFQFDYVGRQWRALSGLQRDKQALYISHKLSAAVDRIRMRFGYMARTPAADTAGLPATLLYVREAMRVAMMNYRPRPYRASPVQYLRADTAQADRGDPLPVWMRVAERGLVVANVHGSHTGILVEANVPYAALVLDRVLSGEVQSRAH